MSRPCSGEVRSRQGLSAPERVGSLSYAVGVGGRDPVLPEGLRLRSPAWTPRSGPLCHDLAIAVNGLFHGSLQEGSRCCRGADDRCSDIGALCLETLAAEHRTPLRRLERNSCLDAARGAMSPRLRSRDAGRCRAGASVHARAGAPTLARLAPLWVVLELFIEEEELFAGSKDKVAATVDAG